MQIGKDKIYEYLLLKFRTNLIKLQTMKYRRKEIIEALQWNGRNQAELKAFAGQFVMFDYADVDKDGLQPA